MTPEIETTLQYGPLIIGLGGGLALFLYGRRMMAGALKLVAGSGMKAILARLTTNQDGGQLRQRGRHDLYPVHRRDHGG